MELDAAGERLEQPIALYLMRPNGSADRMLIPDPCEGWPIPWVWLERWPL